LNILFISPNSPNVSIGGIERYITNLINYYRNRKEYQISIIMPTISENTIKHEGRITIYYTNTLSIPRTSSGFQKIVSEKANLFSQLVDEIITEKDIDIICAENFMFGPPAVYSLQLNMVASSHKIPLVLRLHMYPASPLQIELVNQLMWSKISCVSKSITGDCYDKGSDINNLSTDYLGVDTNEFSQSVKVQYSLKNQLNLTPDSKLIMTATIIIRGKTNILKEKGLINLIQAFSKLSPRYPKLRLLIALGRASKDLDEDFQKAKDMLIGYLKLHHIESQTILQIFELEEMPSVYRGADLFVLPAEMNETFGQVFIESMSCGTPVIGAQTGGIPEIISDNYNGFLVPPEDSSILAQRMEQLLIDPILREKFIKNGIQTVEEKFTAEKQFSLFIKMLESIYSSNNNKIEANVSIAPLHISNNFVI
jgi:glycosyltransferase involved in cell wall biosynthesis